MQNNESKIWFADDGTTFKGAEPYFFDTDDFPWVKEVEAQWTVIRDEMMQQLSDDPNKLVPYVNQEMTSRPKQWKTLGLMFWTVKSRANIALFPKSWEILKGIPNLTAVSFNLLEQQTTIKPHIGNTNAIIRCHLGLIIPDQAPRCGFRVGEETRSWQNGKFLMFCDAYQHTAWNNTAQQRYIMVVDIMRPEFVNQQLATSSRVLAGIYHEAAYQRLPLLQRVFGGKRGQQFTLALFRVYYRLVLYWSRLFNR